MHFVRVILFFLALGNAHAINMLLLGAKLKYNTFKCLFSCMVKNQILQNVCLNGIASIYFECIIGKLWGHYINFVTQYFHSFA